MLELVCELLVLLCSGFDDLAEVQQLVEGLAVEEVGQALTPTVLELHKDLYQFNVVF